MNLINPAIFEHIRKENLRFNWKNFSFIAFFHLVALIGLPLYFYFHKLHWGPFIATFILYWLTGFGITMGYHRLWSHKTFKTHPLVEWPLLILGAMAMQNSALKWSSDHRKHHRFTDTSQDPYCIKLGLVWAHILWIFFDVSETTQKNPKLSYKENLKKEFPNVIDLVNNPGVRLQHRIGNTGGFLLSFGIPALLGYLLGDFWGYFLLSGFLRIVMIHQSTFLINSLAHQLGHQPHSSKDSSRDSFFCALLALGEGYHNFHHTYPNDFRNGAKFYHFDPTKWVISSLSFVGLAWDLRKIGKVS